MTPISLVIITLNEEEHIGRCIDSARELVDEIIVLDSFSTDRTVAIARRSGARIFQQEFKGHIEQKNLALKLARHDLILSLDADEMPDQTLRASIRQAKENPVARAYSMNRCTQFNGRYMRHGLWYPDRKIRLFDRRIARWGGMNPHDKIMLNDGIRPAYLPGDILHHPFRGPEELAERNNRISTIAAHTLFEAGHGSSWFRLLVHPAWTFFKGFILRRGFLEGFTGLSFSTQMAHQVFLKYSKLYQLERAVNSSLAAVKNPEKKQESTSAPHPHSRG